MGLDMYLERKRKINKNLTLEETKKIACYLTWKEHFKDKFSLEELFGLKESEIDLNYVSNFEDSNEPYEVGYWRKANQIHNWFNNYIDGGVENCQYYKVSKSMLEELLAVCKTVVSKAIISEGYVFNYSTFKNNKEELLKRGYIVKENKSDPSMIDVFSKGKIILNSDEISKLLPTTDGFFFGNTNYDTGYLTDIEDTINILSDVLSITDFDNEAILYYASW